MMFRLRTEYGAVYINTDQIAMITQYDDNVECEITMPDGTILMCKKDVAMELLAMVGEIKGRQ